MANFGVYSAGFYIWWLCINGLIYFFEFIFLQKVTGVCKKGRISAYLLISSVLTFLAMYGQSSGVCRMALHIGMIVCFCAFSLKLKAVEMVAPAAIILTLFTFMEGFQAVFMRQLVQKSMSFRMGVAVQMLVSGVLAVLLAGSLFFISRKYAHTMRERVSSYLYILLLPCIFIVWVIRSGLGLDMRTGEAAGGICGIRTDRWAFIWLVGACAMFFVSINVFHKVLTLSAQENEMAMLADEVKEQKTYLEEAKKRTEQYRIFQHDIDNHLLVLSGLISEKRYEEAESYSQGLSSLSKHLIVGIETGNPAADILLREKISFAEANGIHVGYDVHFTPKFSIEDMDICILLANAMDNAIQACLKAAQEKPEISVTAGMRHCFLVIKVANTAVFEDSGLNTALVYGTGLKNIKRTVEKYEGTMEIEREKGRFSLSMLLCLKPSSEE